MRDRRWLLVLAGVLGALIGVVLTRDARAADPPEVEDHVDLERYLGTWYEIASIPTFFQRGCHGTTATYRPLEEGVVEVINRCRKGSLDGRRAEARGKAWVVDEATNARLKVQFFWPFRGDYWILEVGDDYEYAIVGGPDRDTAWILSREPTMSDDRYQAALDTLRERGFDPDALERTPQPPAEPEEATAG